MKNVTDLDFSYHLGAFLGHNNGSFTEEVFVMKTSILALTILFPLSSFANTMFTISKTYKPKNVLHYEAAIKNCKFASPYVSAQWKMNEERGQREGLTSTERKYLQPKVTYSKDKEFDFTLDAVKELKVPGNDLREIKVRMKNCRAQAFTEYKGQEILLTNINLKTSFMTVTGATITGIKPDGSKFILNIKK